MTLRLPIPAVPVVGPTLVGWKIWDEVRRTLREDPLVWERQIRAFDTGGFGGAKVNDVIHYMDRLITSRDPAMVVLYIGANDMLGFGRNRPKSVAQMQQLYDTLLTRLHDRLPRARIVVLATFPSPLNARWRETLN